MPLHRNSSTLRRGAVLMALVWQPLRVLQRRDMITEIMVLVWQPLLPSDVLGMARAQLQT